MFVVDEKKALQNFRQSGRTKGMKAPKGLLNATLKPVKIKKVKI